MSNVIKTSYGEGGAQLTPGASGEPALATVLRGIADDLTAAKGATITAPALLAFTDPPSAAEMALLRTLVNEIRTALNTTAATSLNTVKG
jgi:hypothetical protein